jgi:hypothetical protein
MSVDEDPRPGVSCGGMSIEISFFFDARLDGRASACGIDERGAVVFNGLLVSAGLLGENEPESPTGDVDIGSIV